MLSAEEMLNYCRMNEFGRSLSEEWSLRHFKVVESALSQDEVVHMSFLSLGNLVHYAQEKTQKAYVITDKRLLIGQSKKGAGNLKTIQLDDINEINSFHSIMKGIIVVDTKGGKITIDLPKDMTEYISDEVERVLFDMQFKHEQIRINFNQPIKEKEDKNNIRNREKEAPTPLLKEPKDKKQNIDQSTYENRDNSRKGIRVLDANILDNTKDENKTDNMLNFGDERDKHQTYKSLLDEGILTPDEYDEMVNK